MLIVGGREYYTAKELSRRYPVGRVYEAQAWRRELSNMGLLERGRDYDRFKVDQNHYPFHYADLAIVHVILHVHLSFCQNVRSSHPDMKE